MVCLHCWSWPLVQSVMGNTSQPFDRLFVNLRRTFSNRLIQIRHSMLHMEVILSNCSHHILGKSGTILRSGCNYSFHYYPITSTHTHTPLIWGDTLYLNQSVERIMATRCAPAEWPHKYSSLLREREQCINEKPSIYDDQYYKQYPGALTWCVNTAEWQPPNSCAPEIPSDPYYLWGEWRRESGNPIWCQNNSWALTETWAQYCIYFCMNPTSQWYLSGQCCNQQRPPQHPSGSVVQPWNRTPPCCKIRRCALI